jgi:CheY-like chemotaxis protein
MRPEEVASGSEALERMRTAVGDGDPFSIVLLDARMPGMDGEAVARAITADEALCSASLVLLTSYGTRGDAHRVKDLGFAGYLVKPVRPDTLRDVLRAVLAVESTGNGSRNLVTRHSVADAQAVTAVSDVREDEGRWRRVLLAEDNIVNQKVAVRMLEKLGCGVDVAANGKEAVAMWAELPYDAVFMDCQMPEMDGYAATGVIRDREKASHTPIVAMTANAMEGDKERCLAAGMDDYISKPVTVDALTQVLNRWVPVRRAEGSVLEAS